MPQPNWLVNVGLAKETIWGNPITPPTVWLSCPAPVYTEKQESIFDKGLRGIRSATQGLVLGTAHAEVDFPDMPWYGDDSGHLLMAMLGQDTLTGSARTGTIGAAAAGAVSLTYTVVTGSAPLIGDAIKIDAGLPTQEIVVPTNVTGAGPYTLTVPATKFAHSAAAPATILFKHTLSVLNSGAPPSYTAAKYDALIATARQIAGVYFEECNLKFANPGMLTVGVKGKGKLGTNVTKGTPAYSSEIFNVPWQGIVTLAGAANARLVDLELSLKAANDQIFGMVGNQSPTAAIPDQLTVTGKFTFVPDDYTEFNYYLQNTQPSFSIVLDNGSTRTTLQMSQVGFIDPTVLNHGQNYTMLDANFEAIANATDAGTGNAPIKAILQNARSTAY